MVAEEEKKEEHSSWDIPRRGAVVDLASSKFGCTT